MRRRSIFPTQTHHWDGAFWGGTLVGENCIHADRPRSLISQDEVLCGQTGHEAGEQLMKVSWVYVWRLREMPMPTRRWVLLGQKEEPAGGRLARSFFGYIHPAQPTRADRDRRPTTEPTANETKSEMPAPAWAIARALNASCFLCCAGRILAKRGRREPSPALCLL